MDLLFIFIVLIFLVIIGFIVKKWANGPLNPIKKNLTGKYIIVTGSSDGIGLETAKDLLKANAKVIFACRNKTKTEEIINSLPEEMKQNSFFVPLDLNSFQSIKDFAQEIKFTYPKIDILINNAGISVWGDIYKTEDGYLNAFQVNYLGNALLTSLLLDHFNENEAKIINVSSMAYKRSKITYGYSKYLNNYDLMIKYFTDLKNKQEFYSDTKLLLNYFTQYIAKVSEEKYPYLKIFCLHPGVIFTKIFTFKNVILNLLFNLIFRNILYFFTKDVVHGAQTTLFLSYSDNKDLVNGGYYNNLKIEKYVPVAKDEKIKNEMVNETLNILKSKYQELEYMPLSK